MAEDKNKKTDKYPEINYIIYDIETGGLDAEKHGMTEIAMIAIDGESLEEIGRYESLIQPYEGAEYDWSMMSDITGITQSMLMSGKQAKDVAKDIVDFIDKFNGGRFKKPILCGHNIIDFDNKHLVSFLTKFKKDISKYINKDVFLDTMWISRMEGPLNGDSLGRKHNLADACSRHGIEVTDAHRAMNDVIPNTELVIEYLQRIRGAGSLHKMEDNFNQSFRETFKF